MNEFNRTDIKKSKKIQQILIQLQKKSESEHDQIDFSKFDAVQQDQFAQKSFTSQMFNRAKQQSQPQSKEKPQFQFSQNTSRDIGEISYLYSSTESFRFDRSMSFQVQNQEHSRFQRLKDLLSRAKENNLDAFYKNIEQTANQNREGNVEFQDKNRFKEYTRKMRAEKRQQQAQFQVRMTEKKARTKANSKILTANLFGSKAVQAFKKKSQNPDHIDNFLPPQYSQQNHSQQQIDFFGTNNFDKVQKGEVDNHIEQKKSLYEQGEQFFNLEDRVKGGSAKIIRTGLPLAPIREEKYTILDHSFQQRKFQELIHNYTSMKSNYNVLMEQLKQTSKGQFQLMDEMHRIKHDCNAQSRQSRTSSTEQKRQKKEQKQKAKQTKQKQLQQIRHQIQGIKAIGPEKDVAYMKINEKIQQLEQLVRTALEQVQQQKNQNSEFTPKVINYFSGRDQHAQEGSSPKSQQQLSEQQADLSRDSQNPYEVNTAKAQPQSDTVHRSDERPQRTSKHSSKSPVNMLPFNASIKMQAQQRYGYVQKNISREQLNFVDEFSSPLQLDLSVGSNTSYQSQQSLDIPFNPPDYALEYLPLKLDQTQTKNLRSILTQKSSILFESFQFLITVRYTMQQDQTYPVLGSLRVANKCAIDLLDLFVLVYGPQGQNVEVSPSKIYQERLNYNSNIFFQVKLDKMCIEDNGFNVQVCYKTDSITKKKINFKALLPIVQLIRPQFCYEQNFLDSWDIFKNQIFIRPRKLNFKQIRNHEDLKLVLPFINIAQEDPNIFSYGLMFRYPKSKTIFMLKIICYINGKASAHLRSDRNGDKKLKEQLLNIMNFLFLL